MFGINQFKKRLKTWMESGREADAKSSREAVTTSITSMGDKGV